MQMTFEKAFRITSLAKTCLKVSTLVLLRLKIEMLNDFNAPIGRRGQGLKLLTTQLYYSGQISLEY